jgi:hypothetical protein
MTLNIVRISLSIILLSELIAKVLNTLKMSNMDIVSSFEQS